MKNRNLGLKSKQVIIAKLHRQIKDKIYLPGNFYIASCQNLTPIRSYETASIIIWGSVLREINILLEDISKNEEKELVRRHKSTYQAIKFCIEAVSDLHYLKQYPAQIEKFFNGYDYYSKALKEKDALKAANLLRKTSKLDDGTTKRVQEAFSQYQQAYAMSCIHAHLNIIGIMIETREIQKVASDLLYNTINAIGATLIKLIELTSDNVSSNIPKEAKQELCNLIQDAITNL